jgi:YbbR domain-containing protein
VLKMSKQAILRDTTLKILSLVFAILLWFYVITEQNPVVPKDITIPVKIINVDSLNRNNLVMLDNPESFSVTLRLKGKKEILDTVNQNSLNAYADLNNYTAEGENTIPVIINGLPDGITVTSRSEHNIKINLDKKLVVQKPISANITGNPMGGLANLNPILSPTEVVLTGAESILEKIVTVRADVDIAGVDTNVNKRLPIRLLDEAGKDVTGVQMDIQWVNVTVPVANTKRVPIQLVLEGTPGEGYVLADNLVHPREILVTGNQQALDNLTVINSSKISINNLVEDLNLPIILDLPVGIQVVNAKEPINAIIDIQRLVTNTIDITNIEYRNLNDKYIITDFPARSIRVVVRGPEDVINNIGKNLTLYVDLSNAKEGLESYEILASESLMLEILELEPKSIGLDIKIRE